MPYGLNVEIGSASGFTDLFDQQMISTVRDRSNTSASAVDHLVGRAIEASDNLDILTELRSIRQMLNGMMITRPEGLDVTLGHAAPVRLHQAGFRGVLSLELFNREYWEQDPLEVAKTGLRKTREAVLRAQLDQLPKAE